MKKPLIILITLMCLLLSGCNQSEKLPLSSATEVPTAEATQEPAEETTAAAPAKAYLVVTVANAVYEPIPLYEAGRYTVRRGDFVNVIEVTENSVVMAESSCDNQDCVYQGVVSLVCFKI